MEVREVLTKREKEILMLVADAKANGETVRELAERTYNAYGTICFHLRNVYEKLGVTNLAGAIRRAEGAGLVNFRETVESPEAELVAA